MINLWIIRHGKTLFNEKIQNHVYGLTFNKTDSYSDPPLSKKGIKEIKNLSTELKTIKFDFIYSSEFIRAKQTTKIISHILNFNSKQIFTDSRLNEIYYGIFEGKTFDESCYLKKEIERMNSPLDIRFPDGESFNEVYERINTFLLDLKKKHNTKQILIITHNTVIKLFLIYFGYDSTKNIILGNYQRKPIFHFKLK